MNLTQIVTRNMTDTAVIPLMSRDGPEATMHEEAQPDSWRKRRSNFKSNARAAWKFTVASGVLAGTVILLIFAHLLLISAL